MYQKKECYMKKFLLSTITAIALFCTVITVGCGGDDENSVNYSETYQGAVSSETYETRDEAVKGFIATEISGKTCEAVLVGYEKEKELSEQEIDSLAIDEEYKEGLISVEKGKVAYAENSQTTVKKQLTANEAGNDTDTKDIYILEYTNEYRFFTPSLEDGDTLTASYFNSTFDNSKYLNCTMEMDMKTDTAFKSPDMKMTSEGKWIMKVTPEAMYAKAESKTSGLGQPFAVSEVSYFIDTTDGVYEIAQKGNTWNAKKATDNDTGTIEETVTESFMEYFKELIGDFDHTYFEKSPTGYTLRADKLDEFIKTQQDNSFIGVLVGLGYKFDEPYVINIADGRLSDVRMKISNNMNNEVINSKIEFEMNIKFYDFGSTVVSVPTEGINALPDGVTAGKPKG